MTIQTSNPKEFPNSYSRSDSYMPVGESESRHYHSNYPDCPMVDAYVPNSEMEITNVEKQVSFFVFFWCCLQLCTV
jgi:hypothetical protein